MPMSHESKLKVRTHNGAKAGRSNFNVVVVYDDRNAASRAMNVVSGLVRQFGDDFELRCDLWRFDILGLARARKAAARAGDAADLLIVSASGETDLPMPVRDWLNWCADGKTPGSAALVALLESNCRLGDAQCRTRRFLQSVADRNLMDFFLHEVDLPRTSPRLAPEAPGERAKPVLPVFQKIFRRGEPPPRSRT